MVPALNGVLTWNGIDFNCPSANTLNNNILSLLTSDSQCPQPLQRAECGPYTGTLSCLGNESLTSDLYFVANHSMHGGEIMCVHRGTVVRSIILQVEGMHSCMFMSHNQ